MSSASKVLVVGKREAFEWLAMCLARQGSRLLIASNYAAAFDLFVRERPHALVIDDDVADGSPGELTRQVRALEPGLPVIVQSTTRNPEHRRRMMHDLDLHGIHLKDEDAEHLLELIGSALNATRRAEHIRADQNLRSLLLAKFCHDVRNALHAIRGYADMLHGNPGSPEAQEIATRLGVAANTVLGLAQHYLDLARLQSPGVIVRRERVVLEDLIADLSARAERQIGQRPVRLATSGPPSTIIYTDGEKLHAILAELVENAIKFCPAGTIWLDVRTGPGGTRFVVQDPGVGTLSDELSTLFEPFRQGHDQIMASIPGQGIGLAIAHRLSALLGGSLTAERGANGGAIFTLSLPAVTEAAASPAQVLH